MALPKGDQYNEAVQTPQLSFSDVELRSSKVETDFLGLPKPYSGGFTVTFKLQNGVNSWAVRCMIRNVPELQKRYQAITDFFAHRSSSYFSEAKFLQNGIKVNGAFYPIIKMKWMTGDPINIYLSNHYKDKTKVESLLNDFQSMVTELERLGIAHGDLQQGNMIINNGKIHLIDYDGMYLPALYGMPSNEIGHPNFQHPQRTGKDFNDKIDRFSTIVIYLSLKALIYRPQLWNKYHNSDNLIIKSKDIGDLAGSPIIAELNAIPELKLLVERFVGVCHMDFNSIPSLKEFINGNFFYDKSRIGKISVKGSQYDVLDGKMKGAILEHYGERVEVVGYLSGYKNGITSGGKPYYFLNMGKYPNQTFTITVWSEGISSLANAGFSPASLVNKWIAVIGVITSYKGLPQTVAEQASQIQILHNEQDALNRLQLKRTQVPLSPGTSSSPSGGATTGKKIMDKEAQVFTDLYKNMPVSNPVTPNPATKNPVQRPTTTLVPRPSPAQSPPPVPTKTPNHSNSGHYTPSSSSSGSKTNNGFQLPVLFAVLGAVAVGALTNGKFWFFGAILGGAIGILISREI